MRSRPMLVVLAVLVLGAVALGLPWATRERTWRTSTPVPPGLLFEAPLVLDPGQRACTAPAVVEPRTARAVLGIRTRGGPPLDVEAAGPGYASRTRVPGGYPRGALAVGIEPPRHAVAASLCVTDAGRRPVALATSIEPRRATSRVDGRPAIVVIQGHRLAATVVLTLQEARRRTIADGAWAVIERMTAFRPGFVSSGVIAVLLVLLVLLAAAGAPWAYARALAGDEERRRPTG